MLFIKTNRLIYNIFIHNKNLYPLLYIASKTIFSHKNIKNDQKNTKICIFLRFLPKMLLTNTKNLRLDNRVRFKTLVFNIL